MQTNKEQTKKYVIDKTPKRLLELEFKSINKTKVFKICLKSIVINIKHAKDLFKLQKTHT